MDTNIERKRWEANCADSVAKASSLYTRPSPSSSSFGIQTVEAVRDGEGNVVG